MQPSAATRRSRPISRATASSLLGALALLAGCRELQSAAPPAGSGLERGVDAMPGRSQLADGTGTPTQDGEPPIEEPLPPVGDATANFDPTAHSDPIYTAEDALARSLKQYPADHPHRDEVVRLVRMGTADEWRHSFSLGTELHSPAWIVGLLGSGLTESDASPFADPTPVDGLYYVWDANSGFILGIGPLTPAMHAELAALPNEDLPIEKATAIDFSDVPTATPEPAEQP